MTIRLFTLVSVLNLACVVGAESASSGSEDRKPTFIMHIGLKESTISAGADAVILVSIKNTTAQEIAIASSYRPYAFDVTYRGNKAARLPLKRRTNVEKDGRIRIYPDRSWADRVPAGGVVHDSVSLTRFFDLSQPGEYTIRLRRNDTETMQVVTSNTITLTVTGDSSEPKNPEK